MLKSADNTGVCDGFNGYQDSYYSSGCILPGGDFLGLCHRPVGSQYRYDRGRNGRIGTAFAIRRLGIGWGITVGVLDFLKGVAAAALPLMLELSIIVVLAAVGGSGRAQLVGLSGVQRGAGGGDQFRRAGYTGAPADADYRCRHGVPVTSPPDVGLLFGGVRRTTLLYGIFPDHRSRLSGLNTVFSICRPLPG